MAMPARICPVIPGSRRRRARAPEATPESTTTAKVSSGSGFWIRGIGGGASALQASESEGRVPQLRLLPEVPGLWQNARLP